MILASIMKKVSLTQLLSSCMDASRLGCEIIRDFYKQSMEGHGISGTLKEGGEIKSVVTQADIDAQARIVGSLRKVWGEDLRIIGEEDEQDDDDDVNCNLEGMNLNLSILNNLDAKLMDEKVSLEDVVLFVDPLDGTREFVEGRLQNVACLIGVAKKNRPIAGVIGLPFPNGASSEPVLVHYAIADQADSAGCWPYLPIPSDSSSPASSGITILTGDSKDPVLLNATACALALTTDPQHVLVGGTAAKLQIVATRPNSLAILHFKTELWDTCAPQALIESHGGKVTDLFGAPLVHSPDRPFGNLFGVVASSGDPQVTKLHDDICKTMRADVQSVHKIFERWIGPSVPSGPQAMDIARDLDGLPLSLELLEQQILGDGASNNAKLKSYSASEDGSWRGMMSNGVRLQLSWESPHDNIPPDVPSSAFYKRVVMAGLLHARNKVTTAPHKLLRDVKSYQVETTFLTGEPCDHLRRDTGIKINRVYASDQRPVDSTLGPEEQLQSRFSMLLEDFNPKDGWYQKWLLDETQTKATLQTYAKMHAYFWQGSNFWREKDGKLGKELEDLVWENGGYMQPKLQGHDQLQQVAQGWEKRYPTFKEALARVPELQDAEDLGDLGARLEAISAMVGKAAHPFGGMTTGFDSYRTLIHGDPKQANVFFRMANEHDLQVGLVDFQWTGFGLAATDIAHHLSAAVLPSCLSNDGEKEKALLDFYHEELVKNLVRYGVAKNVEEVKTSVFPRVILQQQYEIALLDICRMVFAYAWQRWKEETEPTEESFNRNAYNKCLDSALWLICRCHFLLQSYDKGTPGEKVT